MREYSQINEQVQKTEKIICNGCGKELSAERGILKEGVLSVDKMWDYFSDKDGEMHCFDLCENCYDKIISRFSVPVTVKRG